MNSDAAGAKFYSVQNQIVTLRADFPWSGFQFFQIFFEDSREGVLRTGPVFFGFAPLKKREASEPEKFPFGFVDEAEGLAELQTELSGSQRGGFGAFDLFFVAD